MFFKNLLNRVKKRNASLPLAGRMGGGFLPRVMKKRGLVGNLGKPGMLRSPLMGLRGMDDRIAARVRGGISQLMDPNMQVGLGMTPSMKARMMGLPDPVGFQLPPQLPGGGFQDNQPVPDPIRQPILNPGQTQPVFGKDGFGMPVIGRSSDIMPRNPGFGVNMPKRPPIMPGPLGMKDGGEAAKQYPNAGLAALAEEAPEVVKRMGYAPGGEAISLFEIYSRLQKSMGSLSKDEMDLLKDLYSDGKYSAGDMMQKIKDFRSGTYMPRKFEDLETKTNRLSRTMGTGETARSKMPSNLKSLVRGGLGTLTKLPKFSVPSALAGFGAGYLLDNMFADEPEQEMPIMPRGESMEIIPNRDMSNSRQYDGLNVGRTISEQDRQIVEDVLGITNTESISDRDIYYLLQSIQNNPNLQTQIDGLLD